MSIRIGGNISSCNPMFDGKKHGFLPMFPYINQYRPCNINQSIDWRGWLRMRLILSVKWKERSARFQLCIHSSSWMVTEIDCRTDSVANVEIEHHLKSFTLHPVLPRNRGIGHLSHPKLREAPWHPMAFWSVIRCCPPGTVERHKAAC